jgi:hypothetical protein
MNSQLINVLDFKDHQLRIFGTDNKPLFVTEDVVKILDIKDIKSIKLDSYEKQIIDISDIQGRQHYITVLTYIGLLAVLHKVKKPISREFKQWTIEMHEAKQNTEKTLKDSFDTFESTEPYGCSTEHNIVDSHVISVRKLELLIESKRLDIEKLRLKIELFKLKKEYYNQKPINKVT